MGFHDGDLGTGVGDMRLHSQLLGGDREEEKDLLQGNIGLCSVVSVTWEGRQTVESRTL